MVLGRGDIRTMKALFAILPFSSNGTENRNKEDYLALEWPSNAVNLNLAALDSLLKAFVSASLGYGRNWQYLTGAGTKLKALLQSLVFPLKKVRKFGQCLVDVPGGILSSW